MNSYYGYLKKRQLTSKLEQMPNVDRFAASARNFF